MTECTNSCSQCSSLLAAPWRHRQDRSLTKVRMDFDQTVAPIAMADEENLGHGGRWPRARHCVLVSIPDLVEGGRRHHLLNKTFIFRQPEGWTSMNTEL